MLVLLMLGSANAFADDVLKSLAEVKQFTEDTQFTLEIAENTVQVAAIEHYDDGSVATLYLWDGTDGLYLFYGSQPSWDISSVKVGDYISGTLSGLWEYDYWDVYDADGSITIGQNAPVQAQPTKGRNIMLRSKMNRYGVFQLNGTYKQDVLQFVSGDGVVFNVEDQFHCGLPAESGNGTLTAMFYIGDVANYLWPLAADAMESDGTPYTADDTIAAAEVYNLKDLKRCRQATNLVLREGYAVQLMGRDPKGVYLWDGTTGIRLIDGLRVLAGTAAGTRLDAGTLSIETEKGMFGVVAAEEVTTTEDAPWIAPREIKIADIGADDAGAYLKMQGTIEQDAEGNYLLRDGSDFVILSTDFVHNVNLQDYVGKTGSVSAVYDPVGFRFMVLPEDFFSEQTDAIDSPSVSAQTAASPAPVYNLQGMLVRDTNAKGIYIKGEKKILR